MLMTNPLFLFLLVVTLFVGYGRQSLFMLRPIYVEEVILKDDPDRKVWVAVSTAVGVMPEIILLYIGKVSATILTDSRFSFALTNQS